MTSLGGYILASLVLALLFTPIVRKLAFVIGAVDQPNARKVHSRIMPRLGGVAIYMAFVLMVLATQTLTKQTIGLLLGATIIVGLGIVDDVREVTPKVKLLLQFVAATILICFGIEVEFITNPFGGIIQLGWFSIPVTLLWIIGVTNAVNLVDGLDGLAAGIAGIAAGTLGVVAWMQGKHIEAGLALILMGSIFGFLRYNFYPAKIFMGDSGSMFLGFTLSALSIMGLAKSAAVISLFIPILVLGVPIMDTLFAIIRRYINKQPIFQADKDHLHHRLLASGLSHPQTVMAIYVINVTLASSAVLLTVLTTTQSVFILVAVSVLVLVGANKLGVLGRKKVQPEPVVYEKTTIGG